MLGLCSGGRLSPWSGHRVNAESHTTVLFSTITMALTYFVGSLTFSMMLRLSCRSNASLSFCFRAGGIFLAGCTVGVHPVSPQIHHNIRLLVTVWCSGQAWSDSCLCLPWNQLWVSCLTQPHRRQVTALVYFCSKKGSCKLPDELWLTRSSWWNDVWIGVAAFLTTVFLALGRQYVDLSTCVYFEVGVDMST